MEKNEYISLKLDTVPTWNAKQLLADIGSAQSFYELQKSIVAQAEVCTFITQKIEFNSETHTEELFKALERTYCFKKERRDDAVGHWIYILAEITAQYARTGAKTLSPFYAAYAIRHCIDDIAGPLLTPEEKALRNDTIEAVSHLECTKALLIANTHHINEALGIGCFDEELTRNRADFLKMLFSRYPAEYIRRKPIEKIAFVKTAPQTSPVEVADAKGEQL